MNCKNCGFMLNSDDQFCKNCGTPVSIQNNVGGLGQQAGVQNNVATPSVSANNIYYQQPSGPVNNGYNPNNSGYTPNNNGYNPNNGFQSSNNIYYQSMNNQSSNVVKFVTIAVIVIVALVSGFLVYQSFKNKDDNGSGSSNAGTTSYYKINLKGYEFSIPTGVLAEVTSDGLEIGDDVTWYAIIDISDLDYDLVKSRMNNLEGFSDSGYTSSSVAVRNYGGVEYVSFKVTGQGYTTIGAYSKLDSINTVYISVMNDTYTADFDLLNKISPILKSAKYTSQSNNISVKEKMNVSSAFNE